MKIQNKPWSWGLLAGLIVWLVALVATCSSCAATQMHAASGAKRTPPQQLASTYFVQTLCLRVDGSGSMHGGSAVAVDGHHLLTAQHVIACNEGGMAVIRVSTEDGRFFEARVQQEWNMKDVAQLYTQMELPGVSPVGFSTPRVGEAVCAHVAYPAFGAHCGDVVSISPERLNADIEVAIPIEHGNSGGGVYDSAGMLVGIVTNLVPCLPDLTQSCGGRFSSFAGIL